jgi:hypothetical protein
MLRHILLASLTITMFSAALAGQTLTIPGPGGAAKTPQALIDRAFKAALDSVRLPPPPTRATCASRDVPVNPRLDPSIRKAPPSRARPSIRSIEPFCRAR